MKIRPLFPADRDWVARHVAEYWGAEIVVAHGTLYHPAALPGFVAEVDGVVAGLVTFRIEGDACEIVTLDSLNEGKGVGTALIEAVKAAAERGRLPAAVADHHQRQPARPGLLPEAGLPAGCGPSRRGGRRPQAQTGDPADRQRRHPDPR